MIPKLYSYTSLIHMPACSLCIPLPSMLKSISIKLLLRPFTDIFSYGLPLMIGK